MWPKCTQPLYKGENFEMIHLSYQSKSALEYLPQSMEKENNYLVWQVKSLFCTRHSIPFQTFPNHHLKTITLVPFLLRAVPTKYVLGVYFPYLSLLSRSTPQEKGTQSIAVSKTPRTLVLDIFICATNEINTVGKKWMNKWHFVPLSSKLKSIWSLIYPASH